MNLDGDKNILLSIVNTKLRDFYSSLDDLCLSEDVNKMSLEKILSEIGYIYDKNHNQFR